MKKLLLTLIILTGCGTVTPKIKASYFGEIDIAKNKSVFEEIKKIQEEPTDVRVFSGILPKGLELVEQGTKLVILPGYESKYNIIGSVNSDYYVFGYKDFYWTREYYREKDDWRKIYCGIQAPFRAITLGIWTFLVPFSWPCNLKMPSEENERQLNMISEMKRATKVMGGNLLIITNFGSLQSTIIKNENTVSSTITPSTATSGYVIKEN